MLLLMCQNHLIALFLATVAVTLPSPTEAWSSLSSFMGSRPRMENHHHNFHKKKHNMVMYDTSAADEPVNAWTVLTRTERWISETLASSSNGNNANNPYTRKEVSYDCESSRDGPLILAGIFRRLKEARVLGEKHGRRQEEGRRSSSHRPHTLRQTDVVVIPANPILSASFPIFDRLMEAINRARRNARDYVVTTGQSPTTPENDWSVAISCAHLHPKYGELSPEQELQQLKDEENQEEIDLNYKDYLEKKQQARRSPYPTVVIEVRAQPPPDFSQSPPPSAMANNRNGDEEESAVTAQDIQKLEALFGKTAQTRHPSSRSSSYDEPDDDAFYRALEETMMDQQSISSQTPLETAQAWIAQHDPDVVETAAFTETDTTHVDAAYEFVFCNVAMMADPHPASSQHYLVLPSFLTVAATSLEKFSTEVQNILSCLPQLPVRVETFHPEHVDSARRAPHPILKLTWETAGNGLENKK